MSTRFKHLLTPFLWLCISLALVSCDKAPDGADKAAEPIITLSNENVKEFSRTLAKDYVKRQKELLDSFYSHKKSGEAYGFTQYRNYTWTPEFIEKKKYYQAVLDNNRSFISEKSIKPLFLRFENLIYIGLNLKNGLLNGDEELMKSTLAEAAADRSTIISIAKKQ